MYIPKKVSDRLGSRIGVFQKVLTAARDRDINESDTVAIITDILSEVFGFDKYTEITSEFAIRNTYCDLAIKIDGKVKYLIEVKAIGLSLKGNHLRQAVNYGANEGIQWVVLTNGIDWEIHQIKFEKPIQSELVTSINMLDVNPKKTDDQEKLFLLCKEGLNKAAMDEFAERMESLNRFMVGAILTEDSIINAIRKEFRKIVPDLKVDAREIETILKAEVIKREVLEGDQAKKSQAKIKRVHSKQVAKEPKILNPSEG
jgi:predicted type IV restriction endonuclease